MLSIEENDKITQTGPGTPMGELFRRFWIPAVLSSEIPERDGNPVRFQLLGERLIAFRDSNGKIGVLEERCPHRHASLYWGRNEEGGLRCVYHGWKFDTEGNCLDQPAEPETSHFKDHVQAIAYETHEAGGIIWAYMGPKEKVPPFPEFEWTFLPEDHFAAHKRMQMCNYLQNLEGELDTAHLNFLHRSWKPGEEDFMPDSSLRRKKYLLSETDFGLLCMARSDEPNDEYYWRMTPFHLPCFTLIPGPYDAANTITGAVPLDDTHMWGFTVTWHPDRPLNERELQMANGGAGSAVAVDEKTFIPIANYSNDFLRDTELMKNGSWTGIPGVRLQDIAVQEDQDGAICRRWEEHLGTTDRAIVGARRLLIQLADRLQEGIEPTQAHNPQAFRLRSVAVNGPRTTDPLELWRLGQPVQSTSLSPAS
jgi:phthalate 4,5-dioxygenase